MAQISPSSSVQDIQNVLTSVINGKWTQGNANYDFCWHYGLPPNDIGLHSVESYINNTCQSDHDPWTMPVPNYSYGDQLHDQVKLLSYQSGIEAFLKPIQNELDSFTQPGAFNSWLDAQFKDPNFLTNYPNLSAPSTWADLQDLAGKLGYTLPSYAQVFIECAGGYQQAASGSDDAKFFQQGVAAMQTDWNLSHAPDILDFVALEIGSQFSNYPDLTPAAEAVFENLANESGFGTLIPTFEKQFIEVRHWINTSSLSGSALTLAQQLMQETLTNWPQSVDPNTLVNWFNSLGSAQDDIYMTYPDLSDQDLGVIANICGTTPPQRTSMDILMDTLAQARQAFASGSNDYKLFTAAMNQCIQLGSNPVNMPAMTNWLNTQINYKLRNTFAAYLPLQSSTPATLIRCFGGQALATYYKTYLIETWPTFNDYQQFPAALQLANWMRSEINAYFINNPNGDFTGLQDFLKTQQSNVDLSLLTGAFPFMIDQIFSVFGFESSYSYDIQDYAYAAVIWGRGLVSSSSPDYAILTKLITDINNSMNHPDQYPYSKVLSEIQGIENSPQWSQLQESTQDVLKGVLLMGPGISEGKG
jgi:hypothetical protein